MGEHYRSTLTVQAVTTPEQVLHVFRHDSRHILEVRVELVHVGHGRRRLSRMRVLIEPGRLRDKGVYWMMKTHRHGNDQQWPSDRGRLDGYPQTHQSHGSNTVGSHW